MINIKVYNQKAEAIGEEKLNDKVFGLKMNEDLVHQAVVTQQANERQVLAHTKTKAEVRGGGKKPWRQKGTGRARAGSSRSPIWIGGGVTFGPRNDRNFKKQINRKMKQKAMFIALSDRLENKKLALIDSVKFEEFKTKDADKLVKDFEAKVLNQDKKDKRSILIITDKKDEKNKYSFKNLTGTKFINIDNINIVDILKYRNLIITKESVKRLGKLAR